MAAVIMYLLTAPNGKQYCGITTQGLMSRWRSGQCAAANAGSDCAIHRAIRKYGQENFTVETIGEAETWEELCAMEIREIALRDLQNRQLGYNLTAGGEGLHGYVYTAEHKAHLSKALKGRPKPPRSPEHCRRISESNKGRKPSESWLRKMEGVNRGRRHTAQSRANMSKAQKGRKISEEHRRKISETLTGRKGHTPSAQTRLKLSRTAFVREMRKRIRSRIQEKLVAAQVRLDQRRGDV